VLQFISSPFHAPLATVGSVSLTDTLLRVNTQASTFCPEIIHAHIGTTHPSLPLEAQPPMQHAPIIKDDRLARLQLHRDQELLVLQNARPFTRCRVPGFQGRVVRKRGRGRTDAVEVVPPDLYNGGGRRSRYCRRRRRVDEHRIPSARGGRVVEFTRRAAQRGRGDGVRAQGLIVLRKSFVQVLRGREAIDKGGLAAAFGSGLEAVEELQASRVGEVGVVGVGWEVVVGVGRVDGVR
jgi:hypothetical protein